MSVATARAATVEGSEPATQAHTATTSEQPAAVADAPSLNPGAASSPSSRTLSRPVCRRRSSTCARDGANALAWRAHGARLRSRARDSAAYEAPDAPWNDLEQAAEILTSNGERSKQVMGEKHPLTKPFFVNILDLYTRMSARPECPESSAPSPAACEEKSG